VVGRQPDDTEVQKLPKSRSLGTPSGVMSTPVVHIKVQIADPMLGAGLSFASSRVQADNLDDAFAACPSVSGKAVTPSRCRWGWRASRRAPPATAPLVFSGRPSQKRATPASPCNAARRRTAEEEESFWERRTEC
jgi:hypothetical protein